MSRAQKHVVMPEEVNAAQGTFPAEELGALEVALIGKMQKGDGVRAGHSETKAVGRGSFFQSPAKLGAAGVADRGGVDFLHFVDAGQGRRHFRRIVPVGAGLKRFRGDHAHPVRADQGGDGIAVGDRLAVTGQIGPEAEIMGGAFDVETPSGADVIDDQHDVILIANPAHVLPESGRRKYLRLKDGMMIGGEQSAGDPVFRFFLTLIGQAGT